MHCHIDREFFIYYKYYFCHILFFIDYMLYLSHLPDFENVFFIYFKDILLIMFTYLNKLKFSPPLVFIKSLFVLFFIVSLIFPSNYAHAQSIANLPSPGTMIQPTMVFTPTIIK